MEESIRVTEAGRRSALLLLPEEGFHTTVILDPGAGPGVDQHGDDVLVAHACCKREDVLPWWPVVKQQPKKQNTAFSLCSFFVKCSLWLSFQGHNLHLTVVNEPSDPLPKVQAGDARRRHVSASAHQLLHQVDVLVHHSNVERSHSWGRWGETV